MGQEKFEQLDKFAENPDAERDAMIAEARKRNPHLTEEQLQASWEQMKAQFGL